MPYTYVPILYTTVHILLQRGNGLLHKLHDAEPTRTNRKLLRSASRAHQTHCEWAICRLRAKMLRMAVHMRIAKAMVQYEAQQAPTPLPSAAEEVGDSEPSMPETVTHWQEHFPWQYVTPQALNSRGEQIFYCVDSYQDRMWAWRLERAVDHHRAVREQDLGKLSDIHARDLRGLKDGGLLRWRQQRIEALESRIVAMHKTFHNGRGLGL